LGWAGAGGVGGGGAPPPAPRYPLIPWIDCRLSVLLKDKTGSQFLVVSS
jgi:hypothetical protein